MSGIGLSAKPSRLRRTVPKEGAQTALGTLQGRHMPRPGAGRLLEASALWRHHIPHEQYVLWIARSGVQALRFGDFQLFQLSQAFDAPFAFLAQLVLQA